MDLKKTLKVSGLDDRDIQTVSDCQRCLSGILPLHEVPTTSFISRKGKGMRAELFFFTDSFLIYLPDFLNIHTHHEINFLIYPLKNSILSIKTVSKEESDDAPLSLTIDVKITEGIFTFFGIGENSAPLKRILEQIFLPNLKNSQT